MRKGMLSLIIAGVFSLLLIQAQDSGALDLRAVPNKGIPAGPADLSPSNTIAPAQTIPKDIRAMTIPAELDALASPAILNSWQTATATVTLTKTAPSGGATIVLSCNDPTMLALPPTVVVPGGSISQTFTVSAKSFSSSGPAILIASYQGITKTCTIQINPGSRVTSITGLPNYLKTASQAAATVRIMGIAPAGGWNVPVYIRRPADTVVPASVFIPAGQSTGTLTITSGQQVGMVLIYSDEQAYQNTASTGLTKVQIVAPPKLSSVEFQVCTQNTSTCYAQSAQVEGWKTINLRLGLTAPYPDPTVVTLSSSNPQVASVSPSITFNNTYWYGMAPVQTMAVTSPTTVTITVRLGSETKTAQLQVIPGFMVNSITIAPSSIKGGGYATGTVTLNKAATAGGVQISLTSSHPNTAILQPGVTVPQGQTSATFSIATTSVAASVNAAIRASLAGLEKTANLTVTP